jgi:hypothetical protein
VGRLGDSEAVAGSKAVAGDGKGVAEGEGTYCGDAETTSAAGKSDTGEGWGSVGRGSVAVREVGIEG